MAEFIHDDQSIHYEIQGISDFGLKTPALLLHGNDENMHVFDKLIAPMLTSRSFILMDSRMQGESHSVSGELNPLSYSVMADDAIALMEHLRIQQYDVVGYSDGGIIALLMSLRTYNIRKMVAIGANVNPKGLTSKAVREIRSQMHHAERANDVRRIILLRLMLEEPNITPRELSGIIAETTIVLGRKDNMIDHRHSEMIADSIPRASHKYIENAGHDILSTHYGILSDIIRTLL